MKIFTATNHRSLYSKPPSARGRESLQRQDAPQTARFSLPFSLSLSLSISLCVCERTRAVYIGLAFLSVSYCSFHRDAARVSRFSLYAKGRAFFFSLSRFSRTGSSSAWCSSSREL